MKIYDQYLRDDYMSTESEDETVDSEDDTRYNHTHNTRHDTYNDRYSQRGEYPKSMSENRYYSNRNDLDEEADQKSQPKVSMINVMNIEHLKSNRLNTLMSTVAQTPPLTNRSSRTGLTSVVDKVSLNNNEIFEKESSLAAQNLLKQITSHQKQQKHVHSQNKHTSRSLQDSMHSTQSHRATNKDIDEEISSNNMATLTVATLKLLNQLEIKFPGKSTEDTKHMLQRVRRFKCV